MGQISVIVNEQTYTLGCQDGEEDRLRGLGEKVAEKVEEVIKITGQVGEAHLLLMAAILISDEFSEFRDGPKDKSKEDPARRMIKTMDGATKKIEKIAASLPSA